MTVPGKTIELIASELSGSAATARAVAARSLAAAEKLNDTLNAFLQIDRAGAIRRAEELDREAGADKTRGGASQAQNTVNQQNASGQTPLRGIPLAVKDNICVRGMQATCGSRILAGYHPPYDATVIERLNAAGAVLVGKTKCEEVAIGSSHENSAYRPVRNPWDTERVPGGPSGGPAAAVAARLRAAAPGPEPGGSLRSPAAARRVRGG